MKNPLKTLDPNLKGRDFVVGDIHGCFSIFENLIKNINFNPEVDRMISVGDLIDRGPDSLKCLSLIREPWFHSVIANHEVMMLDKFFGGYRGGHYWWDNGGYWGMEAWNDYQAIYVNHTKDRIPEDRSMELIDLLPLVEQLPYLITVPNKAGKKFHIIHAEFLKNEKITDAVLADPESVRDVATIQSEQGDSIVWARKVFDPFCYESLDNYDSVKRTVKYHASKYVFNDELSHIISGHTILQRPMTILGQTNIDTGAFDSLWGPVMPYGRNRIRPRPWAGLTCVELDTWKFYQATETTFKEVEPLVVDNI